MHDAPAPGAPDRDSGAYKPKASEEDGLSDRMPGRSPTMGAPETLADPGEPIVLTLKVFYNGTSNLQYLADPEWAIKTLEAVTDQVRRETTSPPEGGASDATLGS